MQPYLRQIDRDLVQGPAGAGLHDQLRPRDPQFPTNTTTLAGSSNTFWVATPLSAFLTAPLVAISGGTGTNQNVRIVQGTPSDFYSDVPPWGLNGSLIPLYDDDPRDDVSDIFYGFQCWPALPAGGQVIGREHPDLRVDFAFARTAIGVNANRVFLVVADGEGVMGGHGATFNQLGEFFRDVLGATDAMNLDGSLSTEMVLTGSTGPRHVNTITGEDGTIQINPFTEHLIEKAGSYGAVNNYVHLGQ